MNHISGTVNAKQTIVFDYTHVNECAGYNNATGVFTAHQSGIYFFTSSLLHAHQSTSAHIAIAKNGATVAAMHADSAQWEQTSQSVLLHLVQGDEVFVRITDNTDEQFFTALESSFSGFLLCKYFK